MSNALTAISSAPTEKKFGYRFSAELASLLEGLCASLLVSTYQAGKLVVIRAAQGRLSTLLRSFDQLMGLAANASQMMIATRSQIWFLRNAPDIAPQLDPPGQHDACFVPRSCHVTGDIRVHEIAWSGEELWVSVR